MIEHNQTIMALMRHLQKVPYLASKNLYQVVEYFLNLDEQTAQAFSHAVGEMKRHNERCQTCFSWKEKQRVCMICTASHRLKDIICVVGTWRDLITLEKAGGFQGQYHVLGGIICPLDGIGPEDLTIQELVHRVRTTDCKEIIFAFNQTPEGEATAAYIASKLKDTGVKITCLARGLPVGSSLESMDRVTVFKAVSERRLF